MRRKSTIGQGIASKVKAARRAQKMTIRQCATVTGINPQTLAAIERGQSSSPNLDHLLALSRFLGQSVDELLESEDWVSIPVQLHLAGVQGAWGYLDVTKINLPRLRRVAPAKQDWTDIARISTAHPDSFEILREHPETLSTIREMISRKPPAA